MTAHTIYLVTQIRELEKLLKKDLPEINIKYVPLEAQFDWNRTFNPKLIEKVQEAEILFCDNTTIGNLMYNLPNLKWVQAVWAGVDSIFRCVDPKKPQPSFTLTRYGDNRFGDIMAEYLLGQIINNERLFYEMWDNQKAKKWREEIFLDCRTISDLTIGILGTGVIGSRVALGVKQRGATVYGFARTLKKDAHLSCFDKIFTDLNEILKDCDYVVSILPSTKHTRGILNGDALKNCKKKPVFVSMGRGDVIDEEDLLNALKQNWISKAIVDVFKIEPLSSNSKLWDYPNVIVTPHIGGLTNAKQLAQCFVENYHRFCKNEQLLYQVDWNQGY